MNNKEIINIANKALNEWILTKENDIESHDAVQLIPGVSTYCFYKTDQICTGDCELSSFYIKISCETSTYIYKEPIITIMCYSSDDYMNNKKTFTIIELLAEIVILLFIETSLITFFNAHAIFSRLSSLILLGLGIAIISEIILSNLLLYHSPTE